MKKSNYWVGLPLLLLVSYSQAGYASEDQVTKLEYYCSQDDVNFQHSISAHKGRSMTLNQGPFSLIEQESNYVFPQDQLRRELLRQGVSPKCIEFLITQGNFEDFESGDVVARVYFEFDKYRLTPESIYVLDELSKKITRNNPNLFVEGHTDSIGTKEYNFSLGLRRATSVENYLVQKGADKESLEGVSKGELVPIASNDTSQGRQQNRRMDMVLK